MIKFQYKGYTGTADPDPDTDTGLIFGEVVGLPDGDMVTFQGYTTLKAYRSFRESVDVYLRALASKAKG